MNTTPVTTLTLTELFAFRKKLAGGEVTADDVRGMWATWKASREGIMAELGKMKKDELKRFAGYHYSDAKKPAMVKSSYENIAFTFVADRGFLQYGITGMGVEHAQEKAIDAQMDKWTDAYIQGQATERRKEQEARVKSVTNPETLEEFDAFVRYHGTKGTTAEELTAWKRMNAHDQGAWIEARGEAKLTSDQRTRYDDLRALAGRKVRQVQAEQRKEVSAMGLPAGVTMAVTETKHTTKGHPLWVVRLSDRVERDVFEQLSTRAKQMGGYYSSFARNGAIPGFQFEGPEKASLFMSLQGVDGAVRLEEQRTEQKERAAEHLAAVGERKIERAEDTLAANRQVNTERRANMAANIEGRARSEIQLGTTAVNLSSAIAEGKVRFLDRVNTATKVETLEAMLSRSQSNRIAKMEKDGGFGFASSYASWEKERSKPYCVADIDHASFPWPVLHTSTLMHAAADGLTSDGAKLAAGRVRRLLATRPPGEEMFTCRDHHEVEQVRDLVDRLGLKWQLGRFESYDRLKSMDLHSAIEMRAALREYLPLRDGLQQADPLKQAERALIGVPIPGFFPTPERFADEVVRRADIKAGMRVLEPSCGKGDLVDAIRRACPEAQVDAVEMSSTLISYLDKKGIALAHRGDFLDFNPGAIYDRIVMNPPFEDGQDMAHVQHARTLLAPGGKLVAITSEGPFFRTDQDSRDFRAMLAAADASSERSPDGVFAGPDAFRKTGVQTRIVEIERPLVRETVEVGASSDYFATQPEAVPSRARMSV